tara:strand:- start:1166 stop:1939 length:774 start_codon:yes stop_codon:yes gene_type:complete
VFKLKKSLGQNFLIDKNIISKIINLINIKNKNIVEIGPGNGALTNKILEKNPKTLTLIEKDNKLLDELKIKYKNQKLINYYNEDILKIDLQKLINKNSIIFGNLPYNVSSQILVKLIKFKKWPPLYTDLVLMFQKEVAEKIVGKSYGRLSIIANLRLNIKKKFDVSANCFFPKPKVISTVLHFTPIKKINYKIKNINNLEYITNILFSNKRKMINKNIRKIFTHDQIKNFKNLNLNNRPSDLTKEFYYRATEIYEIG